MLPNFYEIFKRHREPQEHWYVWRMAQIKFFAFVGSILGMLVIRRLIQTV